MHGFLGDRLFAPWVAAGLLTATSIFPAATCASDRHPSVPAEVIAPLRAGQSGKALEAARELDGDARQAAFAQIAIAQQAAGNQQAAGITLRDIDRPDYRQAVMRAAAPTTSGSQAAAKSIQPAGRGGSAFADFDSLMQLIQTTVQPDTWELLGGPSTMSPYPAGIIVDPSGTVAERVDPIRADARKEVAALLAAQPNRQTTDAAGQSPDAWRRPSRMRYVSLRRLRDSLTECRLSGSEYPEDAMHLGGLSRIQFVILQPDDVLLAGPVGGVDEPDGTYCDRVSGLGIQRLDSFATCLIASLFDQSFGCTIDPSREGLQRAAAVAAEVQNDTIPIGQAAAQLREALGMQRVEVFGTDDQSPLGHLLVEADRHMKRLALGQIEMPDGVRNYMDFVGQNIKKGPPQNLLLRLWFTARPVAIRSDTDRLVFEFAGRPIRLSGQNERALASGERGHVTVDPRSVAFVDEFNRHWSALRSQYPIYAQLESVYHAASVSEALKRYADTADHRELLTSVAATVSWGMPRVEAPTQVESIAVHRSFRTGRSRHHIVSASGGVKVQTSETLVSQVRDYPSLSSLRSARQPTPHETWWWDTDEGATDR
ncbi:MAG: DUF1598 domain-containing protein [Planctomycetota bacterium]